MMHWVILWVRGWVHHGGWHVTRLRSRWGFISMVAWPVCSTCVPSLICEILLHSLASSSGEGVPLTIGNQVWGCQCNLSHGYLFCDCSWRLWNEKLLSSIREIMWNKRGWPVWGPETHPASLLHQLISCSCWGNQGSYSVRASEVLGHTPGFWECNTRGWWSNFFFLVRSCNWHAVRYVLTYLGYREESQGMEENHN